MFHAVIAHLIKSDTEEFKKLVAELKSCRSETEALNLALRPRAEKLPVKHRKRISAFIDAFEHPKYPKIYQPIATFSIDDRPSSTSVSTVYQTIVTVDPTTKSSVPIDWNNSRKLRAAFTSVLEARKLSVNDTDIVIDVPFGKTSRPMLKVRTLKGNIVDFNNVTHLRESIFHDPTRYLAPVRVFVAPNVYDQIQDDLNAVVRAAEEKYF